MADLLALDPKYMMLPLDENPFAINADTRAINAPKIVVLQKDQIAEMLIFTIDRYFDYMDLYNTDIYVQWTLPDGKTTGATEIEFKDISTIPGKIRLGWALDSEVTSQAGQVKYSVRFWKKDTFVEDGQSTEKVVYSLNTLTSSFTVSPSLQIEVNPDSEVNKPVGTNLFKRSIQNSMLTGEGLVIPQPPTFGEPGLDLPTTASLQNNTLTLKAQAVVGDTGSVNYEWYYKPAETIKIGEVEFSYDCEYAYNDTVNAEGNTVIGFHAIKAENDKTKRVQTIYEIVPKDEYKDGLVIGEQYYTAIKKGDVIEGYEAYASHLPPEDATVDLYQQFTTYTVPAGDNVKVTGEYRVRATNSLSSKKDGDKRVNVSNPVSSAVCKLISPDAVEIIKEGLVDGKKIIPDAKLSIVTNNQANKDAEMTYTFEKAVTKDIEGNPTNYTIVQSSGDNILNIMEPGWYKATASVLLNRETKSDNSEVYKVTLAPYMPDMEEVGIEGWGTESLLPSYTGNEEITFGVRFLGNNKFYPTKDEEGNDINEEYNNYSQDLFSEKLTYTWTVAKKDGTEERVLGDNDMVNKGGQVIEGLGTAMITVRTDSNESYRYTCHVINELNGATVNSKDLNKSLSFIVN